MPRAGRMVARTALSIAMICALSGCAYMVDRGHDAQDILDIGIVVSDDLRPEFGLYLDFFSVLPIGYADVEGKSFGMGNRQMGMLDFEHRSWGTIVWGSEQKGSGEFDPGDPHQARPDQADETERPRFNAGLPRVMAEDEDPPALQYLECDRVLYLGWIGIHATIRPFDIFDFLLGWTTLDMMGDDVAQ